METRHSAKLERQAVQLKAELKRISTVKNEQKVVTKETIRKAKDRIVYVDRIVTKLENRPVPAEGCATPDIQEWKEVL